MAVVMAGSSVAERHWIVRSSPGGGGVGISWCYVWKRLGGGGEGAWGRKGM